MNTISLENKIYLGNELHKFASELWPINRSLTGDGNRETLNLIKKKLPNLKIYEVPSGTKIYDWVIPDEWQVNDAWIKTPSGKKICEFKKNNLHLLGYSIGCKKTLKLKELSKHLYSLKDKPDAIPYMTSYYKKRWGFCIPYNEKSNLIDGKYEIFIDAKLFKGSLTYGELIIKGKSSKEILLSTYICHPSMANNELSGIVVTTFIAQMIASLRNRKYTYRIVFIPETIGSLTYINKNLENLKKNVIAGYNITCIGDERGYSFLPSRKGDTISDNVARHVLKWLDKKTKFYNWSDRGSDERQYCAPHVNLPIASIMRSKYMTYPEYHTSLDNLEYVVTPKGLNGGYNAIKLTLEAIEKNVFPIATNIGEPQLGKRQLYPTISTTIKSKNVKILKELLTWSDGDNSLLDIADNCNLPIWDLYTALDILYKNSLIRFKEIF